MSDYLSASVGAPGGRMEFGAEPGADRIVLTSANGKRVAVERFRAAVSHDTRYRSVPLTVGGLSLWVRAVGRTVRKADGTVGWTSADADLPWGDPSIPQTVTDELYRLLAASAERARLDAEAAVEFLAQVGTAYPVAGAGS